MKAESRRRKTEVRGQKSEDGTKAKMLKMEIGLTTKQQSNEAGIVIRELRELTRMRTQPRMTRIHPDEHSRDKAHRGGAATCNLQPATCNGNGAWRKCLYIKPGGVVSFGEIKFSMKRSRATGAVAFRFLINDRQSLNKR